MKWIGNLMRRLKGWRLMEPDEVSLRDLDRHLLRDIGFESRDALAAGLGIRPRPRPGRDPFGV